MQKIGRNECHEPAVSCEVPEWLFALCLINRRGSVMRVCSCLSVIVLPLALGVALVSGCAEDTFEPEKSATIEVLNRDPDGWSMRVTVEGSTRTISGGGSSLWTTTWRSGTSKTVSMSATYSSHGGYTSRSLSVRDGERYTWTLYVIPGFNP